MRPHATASRLNLGIVIALCAIPVKAVDTSSTGAAIEFPAVQSGTSFTLTLDEYTYVGPTVTQNTRAFNGEIVGPTLRLHPGTTITLTLTNNLNPEGFNTNNLHNEFKAISVTNLHTHGLHISGEAPGDSIFTEVGPGSSYTYTYVIPANHMGGTFWYHPHHHGSTAIHAGGGAAGMMIVEDPLGSLPAHIASMEEKVLVLQHINMPELRTISRQYEANCQNAGGTAAQCDDTAWAAGPTAGQAANVVLVNGMTLPTISMTANTWYRFRMVCSRGRTHPAQIAASHTRLSQPPLLACSSNGRSFSRCSLARCTCKYTHACSLVRCSLPSTPLSGRG